MLDRPKAVAIAVRLFYATLLVGIGNLVYLLSLMSPLGDDLVAAIFVFVMPAAFTVGILALLVFSLSKGRNWARITLLVMFVGGLPLTFLNRTTMQLYSLHPLYSVLGSVQMFVQLVAMILLFLSPSNAWFLSTRRSRGRSERS